MVDRDGCGESLVPEFAENTPTFPGAIQFLIERRLDDLHVSCPAKVLAYDASTNTVNVQPVISRAYVDPSGERAVEALPAIQGVPLLHIGAGGASLRFAPAVGDEVWLIFASCALDKWEATGTGGDPDDDRRFTLSDAVAIPGIRPFNKPIVAATDYGAVGSNTTGAEVQFRETSIDVATVGTALGGTDEMVHGTGIDSFTGATYQALGNTSSKLRAEK